MNKLKKVYCIIVTYNAEKWIFECLKTIDEPKLDLNIIIVDNGSTDNTLNIIKDNFQNVDIIETGENLGFGKANNLGYQIAKENLAEYIYLLNQDTKSYSNNIFELIKLYENASINIGILSPIHLNDDGSRLDTLFEKCISSNSSPRLISDLVLKNTKNIYEIHFVNAAAWLIKVDVIINIGGLFSNAFFHYGEDENFGQRLKFFGYKIGIAPKFFIHHCRDERKGKKSNFFQKKEVSINNLTIMHNINKNFFQCYKHLIKYSLSELSKGRVRNFCNIILFPMLNFLSILKFRKSYINKNLI